MARPGFAPHLPLVIDLVPLTEILAARDRIAGRVHRTPMIRSGHFSERLGIRLHLKLELFQKTGSFKPRGVLNRLDHLTADERRRGVITLSAGNHAQALAWAARESAIRATVVMPARAPASKVEATRNYGGEVVLTEGDLLGDCLALQSARDLVLVHPFDDPHVIAGQGTVGLEILDDVPEPDLVVVSVGGGGLISGVAAAIRARHPGTRIVGVEPEGADAMSRSLASGKPERLAQVNTIADGLAAPFAGALTFAHVRALVDDVVRVSDEEIAAAMFPILERVKVVPEPAAAAAMAALLTGRVPLRRGMSVVCVLCGGNVDRTRLREIL